MLISIVTYREPKRQIHQPATTFCFFSAGSSLILVVICSFNLWSFCSPNTESWKSQCLRGRLLHHILRLENSKPEKLPTTRTARSYLIFSVQLKCGWTTRHFCLRTKQGTWKSQLWINSCHNMWIKKSEILVRYLTTSNCTNAVKAITISTTYHEGYY